MGEGTGIVSDYLRDLIEKQVENRGTVVWYDPESCYADFAERLSLPDTTVECYDGSFFELRSRIEPLMGGLSHPSSSSTSRWTGQRPRTPSSKPRWRGWS